MLRTLYFHITYFFSFSFSMEFNQYVAYDPTMLKCYWIVLNAIIWQILVTINSLLNKCEYKAYFWSHVEIYKKNIIKWWL